jgi:hypothetical protein
MFRLSVLEPAQSQRRIQGLVFAVTPMHVRWIAKMNFILPNYPNQLQACLLALCIDGDFRGGSMASLLVVSSRTAGASILNQNSKCAFGNSDFS